jgi:SAM-dependent methyltransferase
VTVTRSRPEQQTDFDEIADAYDDSLAHHVLDHYLAKRLRFIQQHMDRSAGLVLDVGCGTGNLSERLACAGYDVIGADPYQGMLRKLRNRRVRIDAVVANGTALPFQDDSFALTLCVAVLHHVAHPAAVADTLNEMVRVTKPGGYVLVWDHNPRNPYWPLLMRRVPQDTGAERLIPEREIVVGLQRGGAEVVTTRQTGLVPDFAPRRLLTVAAGIEAVVESIPGVRRFCAHNVVLAQKPVSASHDGSASAR